MNEGTVLSWGEEEKVRVKGLMCVYRSIRLCKREKPDVAVIRSRGKSKWQRSAALRSPLASAVGAQRSPASACRAFARAASGK